MMKYILAFLISIPMISSCKVNDQEETAKVQSKLQVSPSLSVKSTDGGVSGSGTLTAIAGDLKVAKSKAIISLFDECKNNMLVSGVSFKSEKCKKETVSYKDISVLICRVEAVGECDKSSKKIVATAKHGGVQIDGSKTIITDGKLERSHDRALSNLSKVCEEKSLTVDGDNVTEVTYYCKNEIQSYRNVMVKVCVTALSAPCK